ncbi:transcription antitermination factor NusB [Chlamydiota bacterium]
MGVRRKARECALKLLYQKEITQYDAPFILKEFWLLEKSSLEVKNFAEELFQQTVEHIEEIDALIKHCALNWDMERISSVDKNVLRIALFEMLYKDEIPVIVSINEAIDIAKRYSTNDSGKFVNGILDKAKKIIEKQSKH